MPVHRVRSLAHHVIVAGALGLAAVAVRAAEPTVVPEAWWTGPIAASGAETLPAGHILFEPYLFDVRSASTDYLGSVTYLLYGLTDRLTIGLIPAFGAPRPGQIGGLRHVQVNDLTLTAQRRLHHARIGEALPTITLVLQRVLPLGRYDRLGNRPERGIGSGAASTIAGVYMQRTDLIPTGRILRTRLNLTRTFAADVTLRDASVFGTPTGFLGHAHTGGTTLADLSIEYSLSRRVALATDFIARWTDASMVEGRDSADGTAYQRRIPPSSSFSIAPALEYSWSASRGVLAGVRYTPKGRNTSRSLTPVIAFNAVF